MSSGTPQGDSGPALEAAAEASTVGGPSHSRRQQKLTKLWSYVRREEYHDRRYDWNGDASSSPFGENEIITREAFTPPGFVDAGGGEVPLKQRRPTAPLGLVRTIVSRFNGLMFSKGRHPRIQVEGDSDTEDYLNTLVEDDAGLWKSMKKGRNHGGGMGTCVVGFKIVQGRVIFETPDPRWCSPTFLSYDTKELARLEIRYIESREVKRNGKWELERYWYRRIINDRYDIVWRNVPADEPNDEPTWYKLPHERVEHALGFVPFEWIPNTDVEGSIDGDPDCHGCYDIVEAIDGLVAQSHRGTIHNCDPSLMLSTDSDLASVQKGSGVAIKLEKGGSGNYLEISGQGIELAIKQAEMLEDRVYRLARCVPESVMTGKNVPQTATEIERAYSSMLEATDDLRAQYGPYLRRIIVKLDMALRMLQTPKFDELTGRTYVESVELPAKSVTGPDGVVRQVPRKLGPGGRVALVWGRYFPPTLADIELAVRASTMAHDSNALDEESMVSFVAPFFGRDPTAVLAAIRQKAAADAAKEEEAAAAAIPPPPLPSIEMQSMKDGLFTINEYRETAGYGPIPDGDLTLPQYRAAHPELFLAEKIATSDELAKAILEEETSAEQPEGPELVLQDEAEPADEVLP